MQTLDRSLRGITDTIEVPFKQLGKIITPGPGHVILCTGAPGIGKSAFALWWALHMSNPALYFSFDSALQDHSARVVQMLTNIPVEQVKANMPQWEEFLKLRFKTMPMMFDSYVKANEVDNVVQAFEEFYSQKPSIVIIDNFKDIVEAPTFEAYQIAFKELTRVAKKHRTVVLLLHHVNRASGFGRGDRAPALDSGKFGGEDDAPFVLSLWEGWDDFAGRVLNIKINKNRFGPKDMNVPLKYNYERMQFWDA